MGIYKFKQFSPEIEEGVFIAPSADLIGRVVVKRNANIWFGCVLRGDVNRIEIGENSNIQDLSMLHVVEEFPLVVGRNVTVGHSVVLHACSIGDGSLIGMQSCLLDGCEIGENSLVAAGSLVPPNKKFPKNSLIMGSPAKLIRELNSDEVEKYSKHYLSYIANKEIYRQSSDFERIEN